MIPTVELPRLFLLLARESGPETSEAEHLFRTRLTEEDKEASEKRT